MAGETFPVWPGWETVRLIGRGSFGAVYEIRRDVFGDIEKAALKHISIPQSDGEIDDLRGEGLDDLSITDAFRDQARDLVNEYKLMRRLNNCPTAVNCDDVRYAQHREGFGWDILIKMELLTPLLKRLGEKGELPEGQVVRLGRDLCRTLIYCAKFNIIHRDIKPQNIFVSDDGLYKLGDFGIARAKEGSGTGTARIGTYDYMAPEVYYGGHYDASADLYSLGIVLYWLLNRRRTPFQPLDKLRMSQADKEAARARRLDGEAIPAPVGGSEELKRIVLKACAYDPKERYRSAEEMLSDLEALELPEADLPLPPAPEKPGEAEAPFVQPPAEQEPAATVTEENRNRPPAPAEAELTVSVSRNSRAGTPPPREDGTVMVHTPAVSAPPATAPKKNKPLWALIALPVLALVIAAVLQLNRPAFKAAETSAPEATAEAAPEATAEPSPEVTAEPSPAVTAGEDGRVTAVGSAEGVFGDPLVVQVTADAERIYDVQVLEQNETLGIGSIAVDTLPGAIVEANSLNVDGVSGATETSNAIKEAVGAALASAGIDPAGLQSSGEEPAASSEPTPKPTGAMSYREFLDAPLDSEVTVSCYVQAKQRWWDDKVTIYAADEDGAYFVYDAACTREQYDRLTEGTEILVRGYKAEWAGEVEIVDAVFEIRGGRYFSPAYDVTNLLGKNTLEEYMNWKVVFSDMLVEDYGSGSAVVYKDEANRTDDLYFKASKNGVVYTFVVEYYLCDETTDVYRAVERLKIGDRIDIGCFLYWYEGPNPHVLYVQPSSGAGVQTSSEASLEVTSVDGGTTMTFYSDGSYRFYYSAYKVEDLGTYVYTNGVLTLTDVNGKTLSASGDPLRLHYVWSQNEGLTAAYIIPAEPLRSVAP